MSFLDLVGELRRAAPSPRKAAQAMKGLGRGCLAVGVWNAGFLHLVPLEEFPLRLPVWFLWGALLSLTLVGISFLLAARGIREMRPWGRTLGQFGIVTLLGLFVGCAGVVLATAIGPFLRGIPAVFLAVAVVLFAAQLAVPAFFGIRYLGRLPVSGPRGAEDRFGPKGTAASLQAREQCGPAPTGEVYEDALLPFGIVGTFALLLGGPLVLGFAVAGGAGPDWLPWSVVAVLLLVFLLSTAYNFVSSPYQEGRRVVATFTGGGSVFLFNGSWPFFRLLVYHDGLEVRVMLHRFFVPYDGMDELPQKVGFFSRGLLIRSDLPGVPSRIRFQGFRMKKVLHLARDLQRRFNQERGASGAAGRSDGGV
ncbi:MAG: hypothetical protein IH608_11945 [Proteobacteria bacterium]|nr:hypothetical protein [Pseudomonadota bacterium]